MLFLCLQFFPYLIIAERPGVARGNKKFDFFGL